MTLHSGEPGHTWGHGDLRIDDQARRVALMHRVGQLVDRRLEAFDTHALTQSERVRELAVSLGWVANHELPGALSDALVEHVVECVEWLEALARDAAR